MLETRFPGRRLVKKLIYSQLSFRDGLSILLGKDKPAVPFTVEADPPSIYVNFSIPPGKADALERELNLPDGLKLTPVRCLRDEGDALLLTLNVYRVSGITRGVRAEWSAYVRDALGKPRYMVIEARSSTLSMDPVEIITRPSRVDHHRDGRRVSTLIASEGDGFFRGAFDLAGDDDARKVELAAEWVSANDYIYWRNGICDRVYYNAGLAHAQVTRLPADCCTIENQTRWARFVEPTPRHVLVFGEAIEFMVSPWWNI